MPAAPLIVAGLVAATSITGAVVLAIRPNPFGADAALLFSGGMVVTGLTATAGILLARARWAGRLGAAIAAAWIAVGAGHPGWAGTVVIAVGGATLAATLGPWLGTWLRRLPTTGGVPPVAVALLVTLLVTPAALGAASGDAVHPAAWALAGWSLVAVLLVGRVAPGALLMTRLVHPVACVVTAVITGGPVGGIALASGAIVAALAWRRDLGRSLAPLLQPAGAVHRIPPELAPAAVLHAAGTDESGRIRERP